MCCGSEGIWGVSRGHWVCVKRALGACQEGIGGCQEGIGGVSRGHWGRGCSYFH